MDIHRTVLRAGERGVIKGSGRLMTRRGTASSDKTKPKSNMGRRTEEKKNTQKRYFESTKTLDVEKARVKRGLTK